MLLICFLFDFHWQKKRCNCLFNVISVPCRKVWSQSRQQLCRPWRWPVCLEQRTQMPQVNRQLFSSLHEQLSSLVPLCTPPGHACMEMLKPSALCVQVWLGLEGGAWPQTGQLGMKLLVFGQQHWVTQSDGCVGGCRLDETACDNILLAIGQHAWPQSGCVDDLKLDMWQSAARHRQHALTQSQTDGWVDDHRLDMWQYAARYRQHALTQSQTDGWVDDHRLDMWQYAARYRQHALTQTETDGWVGDHRLDSMWQHAARHRQHALTRTQTDGWVGDHRLDSMWQHAARHRQHALTRTQTDGWVGDHRLDSMWQHTVCHWTAQSQPGGCVDDLRLDSMWQHAAIHWTTQGHSEMDVLMTSRAWACDMLLAVGQHMQSDDLRLKCISVICIWSPLSCFFVILCLCLSGIMSWTWKLRKISTVSARHTKKYVMHIFLTERT